VTMAATTMMAATATATTAEMSTSGDAATSPRERRRLRATDDRRQPR
jgi:hypothetical protein